MEKFELTLTVDEINQVLTALGRQPYDTVYLLINKLRTDCQTQIDAAQFNKDMGNAEGN